MKNRHIASLLLVVSILMSLTVAPLRAQGTTPQGSPELDASAQRFAPAADPVLGPQGVIVLRVYFQDYAASTRYTRAEVEGMFVDLDKLWQNISYGAISIDYQVTDLFQLPENRSAYIDDGGDVGTCAETSGGDLSCGDKFWNVLSDAIAGSPAGLNWTGIEAVLVVMAETDPSQFHRGQGSSSCNLPMGPGGAIANVGCAIFSENPTETDLQVWGRWAHEIGHAFQGDGPAHPSNYNSEFELMDSNYPGQVGVYEKQAHVGYPGWLPETKYQTFTPDCSVGPVPCTGEGGGVAYLWAMEYDPDIQPNKQAAVAYITDNLYYTISVRRRVNGDELNGGFQGLPPGENGIPDEGVLIERVEEGADQVVTLMAPVGGTRNDLWHDGDIFFSPTDGIWIQVGKQLDDDNYEVFVRYDDQASLQPDVMLYPWTSPPGNTWETTDIWIDSPVNGYNTYRYGTWNDLEGNPVPRGNGDDPALGVVNRLYARVRNVGGVIATNVAVNFEMTDPPGLGIAGAAGWKSLGTVTSAQFPDLANILPGEFVDVFLEWTPDFPPPASGLDAGTFAFHTCLRVKLDAVAGETVLGNQDGDMEQENIFYFEVPESPLPAPAYDAVVHLHNDDLTERRFFVLDWQSNLPDGWKISVNGGDLGLELGPGEMRDIPIVIEPDLTFTPTLGVVGAVEVRASWHKLFVSDLDPKDKHPWFEEYGGVVVQAAYQQETKLDCTVRETQQGIVYVRCELGRFEPYYDPKNPFKVLIQALGRSPAGERIFLPGISLLLTVDERGLAEGTLQLPREQGVVEGAAQQPPEVVEIVGLFGGTQFLTSAASGYRALNPVLIYLPLVLRNAGP
jgi:hypothetical protein